MHAVCIVQAVSSKRFPLQIKKKEKTPSPARKPSPTHSTLSLRAAAPTPISSHRDVRWVLAASQRMIDQRRQEREAAEQPTSARYDPAWVSHTKHLLQEALESLEKGGF